MPAKRPRHTALIRVILTACAALFALAGPAGAAEPPQVVDLLQFRTDDPRAWERMRRQSDSAPLTLAELEKLTAGGIGEKTIVEMMRTRKVAAVADADTLLALKKAGASDDMVAALSAYALPPNAFFDLFIRLAVASPDTVRKAPFLYVEAWHAAEKRAVAFMHADLRGLLRRGLGVEVNRDRSDPLLPRTVRSVDFAGKVETRKAGAIELRVLATQTAGLRSLDRLSPADAKGVRRFTADYPAVSLERRCRLDLTLERDSLMKDAFALSDGALDCRWE